METVEIVIKLPKDIYEALKADIYPIPDPSRVAAVFKVLLQKGTVLPKGHGTLKDMGNLQYVFDLTREDPIYSGKDIERAINSMKSIIEADKGESE